MQVPLELLVPWDINTSPDQCVVHNVSVSTVEWVSCTNIILAPPMPNQLKSSLIFTWSAKPLALKDTISIHVYINYYKYCLICGPFALKTYIRLHLDTPKCLPHTHTHNSHSILVCNGLHHTTWDLYQCFDQGDIYHSITMLCFPQEGLLVLFSITCFACGKFCDQPTDSGLKVGILQTVIFKIHLPE